VSTFSGPQGKGAMRLHREQLREEAIERQAAFERTVDEVAERNGYIDRAKARRVAHQTRAVTRGYWAGSIVGGAA
jgi:hypothetical protein